MLAAALDHALKAAGLPIVGVSVGNPDDRSTWTIHYAENATDEQRATAAAVLRTFNLAVAVVPTLSRLEFARLFTVAEDIAIDDAAQAGDKQVRYFSRRLELAADVRLDHPDVAAGLGLLVAKGLITPERRDAILANQPPA